MKTRGENWGEYWKDPKSGLSPYMQMYKTINDPYYQDPYDIQGRINQLDKLIDKALATRNKKAFMKYSKERNVLMLEV